MLYVILKGRINSYYKAKIFSNLSDTHYLLLLLNDISIHYMFSCIQKYGC